MNAVVKILRDRGVANDRDVLGCTEAEIAEIEKDVGVCLPAAYREFLHQMGCSAGDFYVGTDLFYPQVMGATNAAHQLVAEDNAGIHLPGGAVVIAMHQGYQFLFIDATEGDDPPVYYYMEHSGAFVKKADSLSRHFIDVAHNEW